MSDQHRMQDEFVHDGLLLCKGIDPDELAKIPTMDLAGDTVVVSYPKTGTNWTKQLVWLIQNGASTSAADQTPLRQRAMYMDFNLPGYLHPTKSTMQLISDQPHPRTMHSHLPPRYFSTQLEAATKFIVVVRNPKDALVSSYHFYRSNAVLGNFSGTWDEFFELVKQKHLYYVDFFDWNMDWFKHRNNPNVMFVKFEDMKRDLQSAVRKLCTFLSTPLNDTQVNEIVQYCTFDTMKENTKTNFSSVIDEKKSSFMRKGEVGDWKNYFSQEQNDYIDQKYKETLQQAGLLLDFE